MDASNFDAFAVMAGEEMLKRRAKPLAANFRPEV